MASNIYLVCLQIPTGRPSLVEPAIFALSASVSFVTRSFAASIEPLLLNCLLVLLPLREFLSTFHRKQRHVCKGASQQLELLQYGLNMLKRRISSLPERKPVTFLSLSNRPAAPPVNVNPANEQQLRKQWNCLFESIRRRIWQLGCLCRSLNFDRDLRYDLHEQPVDEEDEREAVKEDETKRSGENNKQQCLLADEASAIDKADQWEYKTPQRRRKGKPVISSEELEDEKDSEKVDVKNEGLLVVATQMTQKLNGNDEKRETNDEAGFVSQRFKQVMETVSSAVTKSETTSIAMSRLFETLLPSLLEEAQHIATGHNADVTALCDAEGLPTALDELSTNLTHGIFELFLDLYQQFQLVVEQLSGSPKSATEFPQWLLNSFVQIQSSLLQSVGLFLQREKSYVKSSR